MFQLNSHNAFSALVANDDNMSFSLITVVIGAYRLCRITKEHITDKEQPLMHYDFKIDFSSFPQDALIKIRIPHKNSDFKLPTSTSTTIPTLIPSSVGGELFGGHKFTFIYLESNSLEQYVPSLIDHTATYTLGEKEVRFIFYKIINGVPRLTGNMGNLAVPATNGNAEATFQSVLPFMDLSKEIDTIVKDGFTYYIVRFNHSTTPNIIYSLRASSISSSSDSIIDAYNDGTYEYRMISGKGFTTIGLPVSVSVKRLDNGLYDRDAPTIVSNPSGDLTSVVLQETTGDDFTKNYSFIVTARSGISSLNFKAV